MNDDSLKLPTSATANIDDAQSRSRVGALLREARERQGISVDALALQIKVSPAKIEALESGDHTALPDAAFARALAMTLCRTLKIDVAQVLAGMPRALPISLASSEQRQVPFEASRARLKLNLDAVSGPRSWAWFSPQWLAPAGLLLAAAVVHFWPDDVRWAARGPAATPPTASEPALSVSAPVTASEWVSAPVEAASAPASSSSLPLSASAAEAPAAVLAPGASLAASAPLAGSTFAPLPVPASASRPAMARLEMAANQSSWVEIRDAKGSRLLFRTVTPGEVVRLDGEAPLSVVLGNAAAIDLRFEGRPVDVATVTQGNVARLELK